jgi:hypothetical protein
MKDKGMQGNVKTTIIMQQGISKEYRKTYQ